MLEYEFMRNALYAILIITPLFGIIGTIIVNNKMAFFSDALGHSALTRDRNRCNTSELLIRQFQWFSLE